MSKESPFEIAAVQTVADSAEKIPVGVVAEFDPAPKEGIYDHQANEKAEAQIDAWLKGLAPEIRRDFLEKKILELSAVVEGTNRPVDNDSRYLVEAMARRIRQRVNLLGFYSENKK